MHKENNKDPLLTNSNKVKENKNKVFLKELMNKEYKDKLIKLKMIKCDNIFAEFGEFLVIANSLKKIESEKSDDVIQLDAFIKKETLVDMTKCKDPTKSWNFKHCNFFPNYTNPLKYLNEWCLIRRLYDFYYEAENISNTITEEEDNLLNFYSNKFLKIGNDEEVEYGDGGNLKILSPLYYNNQLQINPNVKHNITEQLNKLGEERNDWQEDGKNPILDIIDPDLNPNYLAPTNMQVLIKEKINFIKENEDWKDDEEIRREILDKFPESLSLRTQYKWIPTDILIYKDLKAKFLGPIHNLPMKNNQELYSNILKVFEGMLPGFQKLNLLKENEDTTLQVVIKAQKYEIKPGMKISEKWHMEGKTENIVASGVYYCNIDKGFQEDKLLFRNYIFPDPIYVEAEFRTPNYEIEVFDGSAVVFSNILPHKFKELHNITDKTLSRTILNFLIVDPSYPIQTETGKVEHWKLLKEKKLKNLIVGHILSFLYLSYAPLEIAKEKRKIVREAMKTEKSGWGIFDNFNYSNLEFFDAFHEFNNPEKYDPETIEFD